MSTFSENLKMLRKQENLTIVELSARIGYSKSIISYWEKDIKEPTLSALMKIAEYFCISIDELTGASDYYSWNPLFSEFTWEERKMIQDYRALSPDFQNLLLGTIKIWQKQNAPFEASNKKSKR